MDAGAGDNHIRSMGYNGTPSGHPHCNERRCLVHELGTHAEINAIDRMSPHLYTPNLSLYATHSPCIDCARKLIEAGIHRVYYETQYRLSDGLTHLMESEVDVFKITPNGKIINRYGKLCQ